MKAALLPSVMVLIHCCLILLRLHFTCILQTDIAGYIPGYEAWKCSGQNSFELFHRYSLVRIVGRYDRRERLHWPNHW